MNVDALRLTKKSLSLLGSGPSSAALCLGSDALRDGFFFAGLTDAVYALLRFQHIRHHTIDQVATFDRI